MQKSETIGELAKALALAQGEIEGAKKDSENPFFKSKYADLASVRDACQAALSKHGIAVVQVPATAISEHATIISVETLLMHSSGEWVSGDLSAIPVKDDPQGIGSCITYLRRYALASFAGVAPEDDDGNAASSPNDNYKPAAKPTSKSTEVTGLKKSIVDVCQLLNQHGDEPKWTAKRVNEFANQHFGLNADALELEPMRELVKKLSLRLDDLKKKPKRNGDQEEKERQSFLARILAAPEKTINEALLTLQYDRPLVDLTLDQLIAVHEEVVSF